MTQVQILSGGAAQGLVKALEPQLAARGLSVGGTFGAVGAMRDKLLAGEPCDLVVLTEALIRELQQQGHARPGSERPLGRVRTGIAVKTGDALPRVDDEASLKATLEGAKAIYFPDPEKATAGIHFMKVLRTLGLDGQLKDRLRAFPNGATAMRAMAESGEPGSVGCTQVTEILYTAGVQLVGNLPKAFELATVYTAAVATTSAASEAAAEVATLLASAEAAELRQAGGFDPL
ncbi:molybdate ABC transporter substrate-binding protein [Ramlibacter humi]|uniref:ABC transporter substrate-binding protein n=1 Tax=Ramlibacter humi TaxID=2530451 RepID=A0A4Z0BZ91_9BURK|nr:substrate-binding domain-containing protein [Ramlibacter humi]TFZ03600.1 ABC transporter substrate-binding protein [Ramlibacter humi]